MSKDTERLPNWCKSCLVLPRIRSSGSRSSTPAESAESDSSRLSGSREVKEGKDSLKGHQRREPNSETYSIKSAKRTSFASPITTSSWQPGATPVRQTQYPLKLKNHKGMASIIENFPQQGLLVQCESKFNPPF